MLHLPDSNTYYQSGGYGCWLLRGGGVGGAAEAIAFCFDGLGIPITIRATVVTERVDVVGILPVTTADDAEISEARAGGIYYGRY